MIRFLFFCGLLILFHDALAINITVKGNRTISSQSVIEHSGLDKLSRINEDDVDHAIKHLMSLDFFTDVQINQFQDNIIISVIENPTIREIKLNINTLDNNSLGKLITFKPGDLLKNKSLNQSIRNIKTALKRRGYHAAEVYIEKISLNNNKVDLSVQVKKGNKASIRSINFIGNAAFTDDVLKKAIYSSEYKIYKLFSPFDKYDSDRIALDKEMLRMHYVNHGYLDVEILPSFTEFMRNKKSITLSFIIREGKQYTCNQVNLKLLRNNMSFGAESNSLIKIQSSIENLIDIKNGDTCSPIKIQNITNKITSYLEEIGYTTSKISYEIAKNPADSTTEVNFIIQNTEKITKIRKINIKGNDITADYVIRRELSFAEGDAYQASKIRQSKANLIYLGYFQGIELSTREIADDYVDIDIEVKEKRISNIMISAHYDGLNGVYGSFVGEQKNFLGRGRDVKFSAAKGGDFASLNFGIEEPYFLDSIARGFLNVYITKQSIQESVDVKYDQIVGGFDTSITYKIKDHLFNKLGYGLFYLNAKDSNQNAALTVQDLDGGIAKRNKFQHALIYSTLNNSIKPSEGMHASIEEAIMIGNEKSTNLKIETSARYYIPFHDYKLILRLSGHLGYIGSLTKDRVFLIDNFRKGEDIVKGFAINGIGPRHKKNDQSIGGKAFQAMSAELRWDLPMLEELGVKIAGFCDAGNLSGFDESPVALKKDIYDEAFLRVGCGAGIMADLPFGTIRVNYSIPLRKTDFDKTNAISFSMGTGD